MNASTPSFKREPLQLGGAIYNLVSPYSPQLRMLTRDFERDFVRMVRCDIDSENLRIFVASERVKSQRSRDGRLHQCANRHLRLHLNILWKPLKITVELLVSSNRYDLRDARQQSDTHRREKVLCIGKNARYRFVLLGLLLTDNPRQSIQFVVEISDLAKEVSIALGYPIIIV